MGETKLSEVLAVEKLDKRTFDIRAIFDPVFSTPIPILHPYALYIQNCAAVKRAPVSREEWQNYYAFEAEFLNEHR